jgi:hypothetical protein
MASARIRSILIYLISRYMTRAGMELGSGRKQGKVLKSYAAIPRASTVFWTV